MEDKRSFQAVKIGMSSAEYGQQRFSRDGLAQLPTVALWRVNLTALSQERNLYFVATGDKVCVYEPDFPFQLLGSEPRLVLVPLLAKEAAPGFISPRHPHCINHLVVGNLGNQEILLLSTDSGNVVAYYTTSIYNAILRHPRSFGRNAQADHFTLRPFFSQWVHESAWGLAIHSAGRMIAVSANTPRHIHMQNTDGCSKVTVFAFALRSPDHHDERQNEEIDSDNQDNTTVTDWTTWDAQSLAGIPTRDRNYKIVLAGTEGHAHNIPCVTFVCESQDPDGSWLLSTDIHGVIKMWRIWRRKCFRTWNLANPGTIGTGWLGQWEAGWLVTALDIRSFRPASGNEPLNALIGHIRAPRYQGHRESGPSWDLTNIARRQVPSNSLHHPAHTDINDNESETEQDSFHSDLSDSEVTGDEDQITNIRRHLSELNSTSSLFSKAQDSRRQSRTGRQTDRVNVHHTSATQDQQMLTDDDDDDDDDDHDVEEDDEVEESEDDQDDIYIDDVSEEDLNDLEVQFDSDLSDEDVDGNGGSILSATTASSYSPRDGHEYRTVSPAQASTEPFPQNWQRQTHKKSLSATDAMGSIGNPVRIPNIPFLHCTTSQLSLFSSTESRTPHVFCARLLKQQLPHQMEGSQLASMDRLNMIEQIPELGIVIIATQVGRCMVCTLTRRESDGVLGLRFDWTLPTGKEERAGIRPPQDPLLGIAVSPIQGRFSRRTSSSVTNDTKENWARDRVINGTPTTFDTRVFDLDQQQSFNRNEHVNDDEDDDDDFDLQVYSDSEGDTPPLSNKNRIHTKPYSWPKRKRPEPWRVIEPSRRYRLMLTYANMTVLTYELARGVERTDKDTRVIVT